MTEQQVEALASSLTSIEKILKNVQACAWDKLDQVDCDRLARARGQLHAEIDHLEILAGKTPEVAR